MSCLFLYAVMDGCSGYISPTFEGGHIQAVTEEFNPSVYLLKASFKPITFDVDSCYLFFWLLLVFMFFLSAYMHMYTCNHLLVLS